MDTTSRREFLRAALVGGAALLYPRAALPLIASPNGRLLTQVTGRTRSQATDSRIEVLLDEPLGTIAPEVYGHFVEHLGGVVYDGIWVGERSRVPNVGGIRRALVEAMREIAPPVVRWPGGCFADQYDWRDGVGPRERRPRRTNTWADEAAWKDVGPGPWKYDANAFGTNEFARFCRLIGAEPYLAVNLRTLPPQAFHQWVEYCNSPAASTTQAELRAAGGEREPFGVRYWGVGNESWGCGGNFKPEEYAAEYRRFTTWAVPRYGVDLRFIGSGPSGGDYEWTRRFFAALAERRALDSLWGWALHHYSGYEGADAIRFEAPQWYELLAVADRMESLITAHWQVMRESDREHRVKLVVDEWGAWYAMTTNVDPTHLFGQQSTIRDAVLAALTLDTFNRHADKVAMANVAQLVNCLHSLFLAHEDRFLLTPTYHVYRMYAAHQGARAVRALFSAPRPGWTDRQGAARTFWGLNGSASLKNGTLTLTVANADIAEPREAEIAVRGGTIRSARATTLVARDVHDVNTFEEPRAVEPAESEVRASGGLIVHRFPPASVTKLEVALG
jgi:alpha-N-arabinofuranosidase